MRPLRDGILDNEKIIEVHGLTKKFKDITAVNNLELNVYRGDVFGFLGPNGAGKSTTIRMLLSLIQPDEGTIKIFGKDLRKDRSNILKHIGAIVEKPDFYLYLTAIKNLEILGRISGTDISKKRLMEILELVGLEKRYNSKVKTFSHGMKQRLGIAQALLHNPDLIILDEPTTGLDPQGIKEIRDLIIHLSKEEKKTIFLSSHILKEVQIIANRMIIINKGTTQIEGYVDELLASDKFSVSFEVNNTDAALELIKNTQWQKFYKEKLKSELVFEMLKEEIPQLNKFFVGNNIEINSVIPTRSLENYFLKITEGSRE